MSSIFTAAALQLGPAEDSICDMVARILPLIKNAGAAGARLAVLPELALTPYFAGQIHNDPSALDPMLDPDANRAALDAISACAASYAMSIVISWAEIHQAGIFNTMSFFNPSGQEVGKYRKMHIPGFHEADPLKQHTILEKRYFTPGNLGFGVHDLAGIKTGGIICYDRRFPESYRALMMGGADVFAVGFNTPVLNGASLARGRAAARMSVCGGAFFNSTHLIAAGKAGVEGSVRYIGDSLICGPEGEVLASAQTDTDEVILANIDLERQTAMRAEWNFRANLLPHAYQSSELIAALA